MAIIDDLEIPFALKDGILKDPSEVASGLACGCICPVCGTSVVARKGNRKRHHFAHYSQSNCHGALETALHLAAKEIFLEAKEMTLPDVQLHFPSGRARVPLVQNPRITIETVHVEKRLGTIIPDIILISNGRELMVEIAVTHAIDPIKAEKIKNMGISTIEINLSKIDRTITKESLKPYLLRSSARTKWVFNSVTNSILQNLFNKAKSLPIIRRGPMSHIDYCPIEARVWQGKPYANFIDDCIGCEFFLDGNESGILCGGEKRLNPLSEYDEKQPFF